jgi:hypothetical protein
MDLPNHESFLPPPGPPLQRSESLRPAVTWALVSVLLGLLSVALLLNGLIAGIPALLAGFFSLRRLNALADRGPSSLSLEWGRRSAVAGMVLGCAGIVLGVFGLAALVLLRVGEQGRRLTCTNNLRELGLAVARYQKDTKAFPTATVPNRAGLAGFAPWRAPPYPERLSWVVTLLPYLEAPQEEGKQRQRGDRRLDALRSELDGERPWNDPVNAAASERLLYQLLCPSHPNFDPNHRPAPTHYPGIAGIGRNAAELPRESPDAGFFGYERRVRLSGPAVDDDLPGGASHTMLCAESMRDNGAWAAGGLATVRPLDPEDQPYLGYNRQFGGLHLGGANVLMVGAEVTFFNQKGNPQVFESLATLWTDE